ncbi:MAG: hypothetical protein ABIH03_00525 [Pseudomonadota bacterium]
MDPFGGVALGAMDAMNLGLVWVGCELEPKFHALAERNIAKWQRFHPEAKARIIQGDSRRLCELVGPVLADCVSCRHGGYGESEGNLSGLPAGSVADCVVGSPPFEASLQDSSGSKASLGIKSDGSRRGGALTERYGTTPGNIGEIQGQTFWAAARDIVSACFAILRPGGHAVWVVKNFVRAGRIVDFVGDWRRLCEACGFEFVEEIHASLVKEKSHPGLFGEPVVKKKFRASFFRRLHQKKYPHLAIDYEVVLVLRKP